MTSKRIVIDIAARQRDTAPARVSVGLRNLSRNCRREILASGIYQSLRLGAISRDVYLGLLQAGYQIRHALESHLEAIDGKCEVANQTTGERKTFNIEKYATPGRSKSWMLRDDIFDLTGAEPACEPVAKSVQQLIDYMARVRDVYSVALLGVLYMLEETVTYAGPAIAMALDRSLALQGRGVRYLRGIPNQKTDFLAFRESLDLFSDLQTQVNIVTASTITYDMYKGILNSPLSVHDAAFRERGTVRLGHLAPGSRLTH